MSAQIQSFQGSYDKVFAAQATFRAVMDAMARPGSLRSLSYSAAAPAPMTCATAAIALTLFDQDTPIWLDPAMAASPTVAEWIRFNTGAPVTNDPSRASFAVIADAQALPAFERLSFGSNDYPDRSTTLIVQVASLREGVALKLHGPGIDGSASLHLLHGPDDLPSRLAINETLFPRGIDLILVADDVIAAIPRTTRLVGKEG